jgi:asparagine synthase (glutamine-hydrolysing)
MVAHPLAAAEGGVARADLLGTAAGPTLDELLAPWFDEAAGRDLLAQASLVDLLTYLPGDILTKVDRMSMAASLEARVPLLDHTLVEFAVSLPSQLKHRDGTGKWIFRQALQGLVPDFVFSKPKQGFGVPLGLWLRNELAHRVEALLDPGACIHDHVDRAAVRRLVSEHRRGRRDHSSMLWRLIVLQLWSDGARDGTRACAGRHGAFRSHARREMTEHHPFEAV